jgi:hypothetical protein
MKDRTANALPRVAKSSTDREDPSLAIPYTAKADPTRVKLRIDSIDPKLIKSNALTELPKRDIP